MTRANSESRLLIQYHLAQNLMYSQKKSGVGGGGGNHPDVYNTDGSPIPISMS